MKITLHIMNIFLFIFIVNNYAYSATIQAESCFQENIQSAIDIANDGDIVKVPSGSCSWAQSVTITKGITLLGDGIDKTVIINRVPQLAGTSGKSPIKINVNGLVPWRLSGFTFTDSGSIYYDYAGFVEIKGSVANWRMDHVKFHNCNQRASKIMTTGCQGLIDHVEVIVDDPAQAGTSGGFYIEPANAEQLWDTPTSLGGEDAIYIEDCTFLKTFQETGGCLDGEFGAKYVVRNSTIENYTILSHGYEANRSTIRFEFYDNTISATFSKTGDSAITWRGGSGIAFNNTITGSWWMPFQLKDYCVCEAECNPDACKHLDCDSYPCPDQVGRMYDSGSSQVLEPIVFFGNTYKGVSDNDPERMNACSPCDFGAADIIQPNRDYYVQNDSFNGTSGVGVGATSERPTTCTIGAYWWNTDSRTLDKCISTNTWKNAYFKPYTYPHPLTQGSVSPPPPSITVPSGFQKLE